MATRNKSKAVQTVERYRKQLERLRRDAAARQRRCYARKRERAAELEKLDDQPAEA